MTLREFFVGRGIVFSALIVICLIVFGYQNFSSTKIPKTSEASNFTWKYEKDDSLNLDGQPQTNVSLEVKYLNGEIETKLIDTVPSGCNDLPDVEADSVPNSTVAQCYGAGLGYRYKVTRGEKSYLVLRKTFEEALPNSKPSNYQYELVAEFPLLK